MKRIITVLTCGALAACSCSENQWEEVDVVDYDEPVYEEQVIVEPEPVTTTTTIDVQPVYVQQPVYDSPYTEVQARPCYQPTCYQPMPVCCPTCGCQPVPQPRPQPKITTTKKVITTTTTIEEPCGKPVCEPVVTTHEEIIPVDASYPDYTQAAPAPVVAPIPQQNEYVQVTVDKNPYRSEIVDMRSSASKVGNKAAIKFAPEAYDVLATRATNRMLQDTAALYDNGRTKRIFLKDTKLLSTDLPFGSQRLKSTTKDIVSGSKTYDIVNNSKNADFIVASTADWYIANNAAPALQYKLAMFDKSGKKVNEWVEIIRQVQE